MSASLMTECASVHIPVDLPEKPPQECPKCGKPRCAGKAKQASREVGRPIRCGLFPISGGRTCNWHGSGTAAARAAALRRVEAAEADAAMQAAAARLGLSVETNHVEALQDALNRAHADVLAWGMQVSQLDPEGWKQRDLSGKFERVSVWVEGYWRSLDRYAQIARDCTSLGIAAAAVDVVRREADQVQALLAGVLGRLGHDWGSDPVRDAVAAALTEIGAAP